MTHNHNKFVYAILPNNEMDFPPYLIYASPLDVWELYGGMSDDFYPDLYKRMEELTGYPEAMEGVWELTEDKLKTVTAALEKDPNYVADPAFAAFIQKGF